ncbi:MAG: RnfABCDGE type electron transport complex subunit B [Oscillospiraceae bacterium]|nr:RnfABCDGE type electron transport complex subunit B [Oscillospiraceae bacterium]
MNTVLVAIVSVAAIGFVCATLLAVASKVMAVKEDERLVRVRDLLPGANCGACGFSGCSGYASAIVKEAAATNLCPPGGNDLAAQLNVVMGTGASGSVVRRVAVVHCLGNREVKSEKMNYSGIKACHAVKPLYGGQYACAFGCMGYGDCQNVCPVDAVCIENGLAHIDPRKCIACGLCVKACPNDIIAIHDMPMAVAVLCSNTEKGAVLKDKCRVGCIGCMKCAKGCPEQAIVVADFLAKIDYSKCNGCGQCAVLCPKQCVV